MDAFKKATKFGLPFLCFMVAGSFFLKQFAEIRYDIYNYKHKYMSVRDVDDDDQNSSQLSLIRQLANSGAPEDEEADIEALQKLGANDEWQNIRGPRPWEDNTEFNKQMEAKKAKEQAELSKLVSHK